MSCELSEGVELVNVFGLEDREGGRLWMSTTGGGGTRCERIVVSMESGQMAGVPWACCELEDGSLVMVNLALVESVQIKESK